jgi:hypothetical protein
MTATVLRMRKRSMMQIRQHMQQLQLHQHSARGSTINDGGSSPSTTNSSIGSSGSSLMQQQPQQQP